LTTYLERDHFNLDYFVDLGLTQHSHHLRRTYHAQVVHFADVHYADYTLNWSFVFVTQLDCVEEFIVLLDADLCSCSFDD